MVACNGFIINNGKHRNGKSGSHNDIYGSGAKLNGLLRHSLRYRDGQPAAGNKHKSQ
jgi:hypothetical protein